MEKKLCRPFYSGIMRRISMEMTISQYLREILCGGEKNMRDVIRFVNSSRLDSNSEACRVSRLHKLKIVVPGPQWAKKSDSLDGG